jgi:hypothetical protein
MFRTLFRRLSSARRQPTSFRRGRAIRPQIENLEDRLAPSASPFIYKVLDDRGSAPGHTTATAQAVALLPMMDSQVSANGWAVGTHDVYRVQLRQGEIFTAADHAAQGSSLLHSKLSLLNASGAVMASSSDLTAATPTSDPALAYRVPTDGTYYVAIDVREKATPASSYTLDLRPVGLNPTMQDPTWLQKTGGEMDVWLDGTSLDISGPAGHGFGIHGNWKQTVQQSGSLFSSTYTATGMVALETANGDVNIGLPNGTAFTIITQPGQWGAYFGGVGPLLGTGSFSLNALATTMANSPLGLGLKASLPQQQWGIDLGSGLSAAGVPLNAAVPYLHFLSSNDASATFGGVQVQADKVGQGFNIVADPADPFLFVGVKGITLIKNFGVGWSAHGLIPFAPVSRPANYQGPLAGNFYHVGQVDLTDADIPIVIDGDWTVNFDPNHTGKVFGGAALSASDLLAALEGQAKPAAAVLTQIDTIFRNASFEHNGTLSLGISAEGTGGIQIPVVQDSSIFDGAAQTLYMHVNSANPFQNTFLQDYVKGDVSLDGTFDRANGQADFIAKCDLDVFGQETKGSLELNSQGAKLDATIHAVGVDVGVTGFVQPNGNASLKGQAAVDLLLGRVQGNFDFERTAGQTSLGVEAHLDALGTNLDLKGGVQPNGDYTLSAAISNFFLPGTVAAATLQDTAGTRTFTLTSTMVLPFLPTVFPGGGSVPAFVAFTGQVASDGSYTFTGDGLTNFFVGSATGHYTLSHYRANTPTGWATNLSVRADVGVLGQDVSFSGDIGSDGTYWITGGLNSGFFLADGSANFIYTNIYGGPTLTINGQFSTLSVTVAVSGSADYLGDYSLSGKATANFFLASGEADFHLYHYAAWGPGAGAALTVDGYFYTLGTDVHISGNVQPNGDFTLSGQADANFFLAWGNASFTLTSQGGNTSLGIDAHLSTLGADMHVTGQASSDGTYVFTGYAAANFYLANGYASMVLANYGAGPTCTVDAHLNLLGNDVEFQGQVYSNGDFSLSQSANFGLPGLANASEGFALSSTGGNVSLSCHLDATFTIPTIVMANLDVWLNVTAGPGGVASFSGGGTASVQLPIYFPFPPIVVGWLPPLGFGVSVSDHTLSFDGFTVGLPF